MTKAKFVFQGLLNADGTGNHLELNAVRPYTTKLAPKMPQFGFQGSKMHFARLGKNTFREFPHLAFVSTNLELNAVLKPKMWTLMLKRHALSAAALFSAPQLWLLSRVA